MTLPDDYLVYPKRRLGPDHARYGVDPWPARAPLVLPGGARLALWVTVALEFFPLNPSGQPFKAPGAMQTPYPDLRHYTTRDYGNRVCAYRLLTVFRRLDLKVTFAVQGAVAERYPWLVRDVLAEGHEICAHGYDTDHLHHSGLDADTERSWIGRTLDAIEAAGAPRPTGWISPARAEGFQTPDRLAEAKLAWLGDWAHDDQPTGFKTASGDMVALPLSNELDDWQILVDYKRPESEWVAQVGDAAEVLLGEAETKGAQILSLFLRPYVSGLPYRVKPLADSLSQVLARPGVVGARAGDLVAAWTARRG